jgi:hypothetical protein
MRKSRIAYFQLCIAALQVYPAAVYGAGLTIGNVAAVLQASPVVPIQNLEERYLIPGAPIFGVTTGRLGGVDVLRALRLETCKMENPRQWFRSGSATFKFNSQGRAELEDLRDFLGAPAGSMDRIDNVDVNFTKAWSLTAPYPYVQENFANALIDGNCLASGDRGKVAMIVRPVLADITLTFMGRGLTKHDASVFISKMDPPPDVWNDGTHFTIILSHRLVALKLGVPP